MRGVLRAARGISRRYNSTSSSSPLQNPQVQKAMDGAQKAYQHSAAAVERMVGPLGQRAGNAVAAYREPMTYRAKVIASVARQVYQAEKMSPPLQLSQWMSAYAHIWARATNSGWWRETLKNGSWATVGIAAVEAYGIFCLGEMVGRRHLVGYKLKD